MDHSSVRAFFSALVEDALEWCEGRLWWWRAPILAWLTWISIRHLADPIYQSLFGGLNLGIHEGGHLVFGWAPQFVMAFGGTLLQCAAPVASAWMFLRQPDYFAVPVCGVWLSDNLYGVATYMADAREQELPLVTVGGGEAEHDWTYMLDALGLLKLDTVLAACVRLVAFALAWSSLLAAAWLLWKMAQPRRTS